MPLITITETGRTTDTPNATVSVDRGMPHPLTITSPFSDADDARLRWYFEEHLRFPFTQQVRASPRGRRDVGYRTISRPLIDGLRQVQAPVQVDLVRPETYPALVEHLRHSEQAHGVGDYHLVHFDLHGAVLMYHALAQVGGVSPHMYRVLRTVSR